MPIPAELDPVFDAAGEKYNVDPDMLRAVALQESNGNPNIPDSSKGAQGMMQIMPGTAGGLGGPGGINPKDPVQAINGAAQLLSNKLTEAENLRASGVAVDPPSYAVMSYFAGKPGSSWGPQTWQYGDQVAAKYRNLTAADGGAAPMAGLAGTPGQGSDGGAPVVAPANAPNARGPDLVRLASAGVSDVGPSAASAPGSAGGPPLAPSQYAQSPSQYAAGMLRQLAASGKSPQSTAGPAGGPIPPPGANPVATPSTPSEGAGGGPGAVPAPAPAAGSVPFDPVGGQLLADLGRQARAMEIAGLPGAEEMEARYQAALKNGWIPDDTGQPHYLSGTSTAAGQISRAEAEGGQGPIRVTQAVAPQLLRPNENVVYPPGSPEAPGGSLYRGPAPPSGGPPAPGGTLAAPVAPVPPGGSQGAAQGPPAAAGMAPGTAAIGVLAPTAGGGAMIGGPPPNQAIDKFYGQFEGLRTAHDSAIPAMYEADQLLQKLRALSPTGPLTQFKGQLSALASSYGISDATIQSLGLPAAGTTEEAMKLSTDLLGDILRSQFPGRITNTDIATMKNTVASGESPLAANQYMINSVLKPRLQRDIERYGAVVNLPKQDPTLASLPNALYQWDNDPKNSFAAYAQRFQPPPPATGSAAAPSLAGPASAATPSAGPASAGLADQAGVTVPLPPKGAPPGAVLLPQTYRGMRVWLTPSGQRLVDHP
jgi:Transglycosylase SLT domain